MVYHISLESPEYYRRYYTKSVLVYTISWFREQSPFILLTKTVVSALVITNLSSK